MNRLGIFVDAGYLFAQASQAITGDVVRRQLLSLNEQSVVARLIETAEQLSGGTPLLRIYWYDVIDPRGPTLEQNRLASSDNVKVRMGTLNGSGLQRDVNSMIVTDMIELARNHAIADAVLISGDEEVRVGVQLAQNYGVRVHLIGIANDHDKSCPSLSLIQESDTRTEWTPEIVSSFLSVREVQVMPRFMPSVDPTENTATFETVVNEDEAAEVIEDLIDTFVNALDPSDLMALKEHLRHSTSLPREFDGKLLGISRDAIRRDLEKSEKKLARKKFMDLVKSR